MVDARFLNLYKIDVDTSNRQQAFDEVKIIAQKLRITDKLDPASEVNEIFSLGTTGGKINIIVELSEGESIDSRACGVIIMAGGGGAAREHTVH